jgi:acetone carboxylase, alpha subunit
MQGEGTPLKDSRESIVAKTKETGYYAGIKKLILHDEDPIRFERFQAKLSGAANAALETVKSVAASPAAREMGELLLALATPEGYVVTASMGLAAHVGTIPYMIGWMLNNNYEENPKIRDGDIFGTNDPRAGCAHPADCYTFLPIFYQGEVVAWSAAITHILDAGHPFVGSIPSYAPNTFFDGFLYPPMKVGEDFIYHQWFDWLWRRRTRTPDFNILDEKARGAGCLILRQKIQEIIEEFGLPYFQEAINELIEFARRQAQERFKDYFFPGIYRSAYFSPVLYKDYLPMFPESDKNWLLHFPQTFVVKPEGSIHLEYEGISGWDWFHINSGESIASAVYYMGLVAYVLPDIGYNSGIILQLDWNIPKGSILNVDHPFASVAFTWLPAICMLPLFNQNLVRNLFVRGYLEECVEGDFSLSLAQGAGVLEDGKTWGWSDFEFAGACGRGASAYMDGKPSIWTSVAPMSDCGNMEEWEYVTPPLFYLGRRLLANYLGHGKYRGSLPPQSTWVVLKPGKYLNVGGLTLGNPFYPQPATTLSGAYPQPGAYIAVAKGTNIRDLIQQGDPLPRDFQEVLEWINHGRLQAEKVIIN